jgi:DNA polymerase III sliding clamp (beta) subunit (PCNA family)
MKFYIKTYDLQKAIKLLSVTAKMNTNDSTGMVLLKANEDNTVTFLSDNHSTALSYVSDNVDVKIPGEIAIEYGKIKPFALSFHTWDKKQGAKDFCFKLKGSKLNISVETLHGNGELSKGSLNLRTYDSHSIRLRNPFNKSNFILNSNIFKTATNKVLYAINPAETRPFLQGMNINFDKEFIYFVGTNGLTLSEYKVKNISDLNDGDFLLKYDFIMGLRRALGEDTDIAFEFDKNEVKAKFDNVCFWGKTIIGHDFPSYKSILESYKHSIVLDKKMLMVGLQSFVGNLNPDDNFRVTFSLKDKKMVFLHDGGAFDYSAEVNFEDEFNIDVNGKYMEQTVSVIDDDIITVSFSDDSGVLLFDSENFKDQKALITPIRRR